MFVCFLVSVAISMPVSVRYCFSRCFAVSAREAYNWCTNYTKEDLALAGSSSGQRKITRLTEGTLILTDIFPAETGAIQKQKLVHLYPDQLQWASTHLTGPNRYSQFLYKIIPEEPAASRLDYIALYLDYAKENIDSEEAKKFAAKLCRQDAEVWRLLAKAMTKELVK